MEEMRGSGRSRGARRRARSLHGRTALLLGAAAAGCGGEQAPIDEPPSDPPPAPGPAAPIIDPAVSAGDTVAGLRVVSADLRRALGAGDQPWVGEVQFEGAVELTGSRRAHPSDPESEAVCFFPDATSAKRLPRLAEDERVSWLCFDDPGAGTALDASPTPQTITIEEFRYVFSFSDVFNTARLASVNGRPAP